MTDTDKIVILQEALDHISDHAPWGGPSADHIKWMQGLALKALIEAGEYDD